MAKITKESSSEHGERSSYYRQKPRLHGSPLPDSDELAHLKQIDPDLIPWILTMAEREQNQRNEFIDRRLTLMEVTHRRVYILNLLSIACCVVIIGLGLLLAQALIVSGKVITGWTIRPDDGVDGSYLFCDPL